MTLRETLRILKTCMSISIALESSIQHWLWAAIAHSFLGDFMAGDEAQRTLYFAMLSNAVATLLRHKGIQNLEEMTAYQLSKAVRELTENEIPARYKRQQTGRKNRRDSSALDALLEKAYRKYFEENNAPPGRKKLAYTAEKM